LKIVILGGGSIGGSVANELSTEENDVIVIDNNQENLDSLSSKEGILTINGNASSPSTLKKANLDDDTLLLCLTDSEEVNLLASIVAKSKFNVGKVVCRLIGSDYEKISQDIASGVDYFINPENLITEEIKELLHHPGSLEILDFVDNRLKLVSVYAKESGLLVGKQIRELRDHLPDYETRIPAIYRDEELIIPNGETIIQKDDEVYFVADEKHIEQVTRELQKLEEKYKNIDMIASPALGGIIVGYEVSRCLNIPNVFVERVNQIFELRRNFSVKNKKILIVEDVITTGKSSLECAACLIDEGADVLGYSSIVDRSDGKSLIKNEIISLIKFDIPCYDPENLPEELKKIEPIKPGSRAAI